MAVHFFDLDGTLVHHGTNDPLPGAVEMLRKLKDAGDRIIIVTRRGSEFAPVSCYSYRSIDGAIIALGLPENTISIPDCGSPRIIYDDAECSNVKRDTNQGWE